jgi:hypothetical protein
MKRSKFYVYKHAAIREPSMVYVTTTRSDQYMIDQIANMHLVTSTRLVIKKLINDRQIKIYDSKKFRITKRLGA